MPDENTAEGDSAAKAEEAPTANVDPPASSGGPSTDRAAIQVVEGVNQKQASARLGVTAYENEEGGGVEKYHSDLDAYRNARRMSRASSRLDQTHLEGHADLSQEGQDTSPRSAELTEKEKKAQERQGAPTCLINLTERIEACTESIQAWTDRQEENARRKKQEKAEAAVVIKEDGTVIEPQGESWLQRNIIVFVVFIILSWVYIVFVWRICALGIRRVPIAVTTRTEGVGLLIGFNILWLMTIWAYIRVTLAGPGLVRDHVAISDPPKPPSSAPEVVEGPVSNINTESTDVQRNRAVAHDAEVAAIARTKQASESQPSEERVQPTLPAFAGPLVAGEAAKRDEEKAMSSVQGSGIAPSSLPVQPFYQQHQPVMTEDGIPEPMRIPSHQAPLHPTNLYCYRCKRVKPPRSHHCRRCATCVLKMDHHCPWVGGCVGAQNHKFFYHFLQWVTALESYVLITNAVLFTRGIARRSVGGPGWPIDGYMISLFPITAMFTLFTTALLITHTYLFILNLTTIEHMAYDRMKTREEILLERYLDARKDSRGKALSFREKVQEKRRMRKKWAVQWGNLKSEANLFWLDDEQSARTSGKARHWYQSIGPNWTQILGKSWYQWFLPLGKPDKDVGLAYDTNWRFGESGRWRMREEWPKAA